MNIIYGLILYLLLLISLSLHEWAHGWAAYKMGDKTPLLFGRLTLNPLAHIDIIGTVILPLVMILFLPSFVMFGWAKPVPINSNYFCNKNFGEVIVALAGPLMNLILAIISALLGICFVKVFGESWGRLFGLMMWVNLVLFAFNLLPIPPLDGAYLLKYVFHISDITFYSLSRYGFFVLLILVNITVFRVFILVSIVKMFSMINVFAGLILNSPVSLIPF